MHVPYKKFNKLIDISRALYHKPKGRFKHFTYILKGTKVISIGFNDVFKDRIRIDRKYYSYPFKGAHSELDAIANMQDLNLVRRSTLVNVRLNHQKELRNSKPCQVCQTFLAPFRFRAVYFSMEDGFYRLY